MDKKNNRVAFHEAGHAIACIMLNVRFKEVSIIPEEEKSLGHILLSNFKLHSDYDDSDKTRLKAEKFIMISLSGAIAERKFTKKTNNIGAYDDYKKCMDIAGNLFNSINVMICFMNFMLAQTNSLFTCEDEKNADTEAWLKVKLLAKELINSKILKYRDVISLLENKFTYV
ncbi:MAG: hypothetical protein WC223_01460 [Bacteroidales bacterium]|jgi:ATP-dependent Zn protease